MLILILILALLLRLININQSLWLDEAISTLATRDYSYYKIIFDFLKIDNHPPLFYLLLRVWGQILGFTDWALRLLPVLIGTTIIFLIYKISFLISGNKNYAKISALLTATSPLLVYYSQEIRMYILITLLTVIQVFIYLSVLKKDSILKWILFAFINCLLFFSDYITVFLFPVFLLYPLILKNKKLFIKTVIGFIPLGILFLLWFPMFSAQLIKNRELVNNFPGWQFVVGGATFKNLAVFWMKIVLGRISFEPKLIYYSLVGLGSLPILISLDFSLRYLKKHLLIWLWLIVPVIIGFSFSFIIPAFNYFRFIYVVPALIILVSLGLFEMNSIKLRKIILAGIILTNIVGLGIYYLDENQHRENWKQAVSFIENSSSESDLVVFEFHEPVAPYRWYAVGKTDVIGATNTYFADPEKTSEKLIPALTGKTRIYHFEYLRDLTDPQKIVEQVLIDEGFVKTKVLNDFKNIGQLSIWTR